MAGRLGDDDDIDEVVEQLEEADLAPLDYIAVGPGRLPELAAERRGGRPGEGGAPLWVRHTRSSRPHIIAADLKTCRAGRSRAECYRRLKVTSPSRRVSDRLGYFVLLKCNSTKVGSGVPGGRSGFTASLNQASC
jgi:hypothetical protein